MTARLFLHCEILFMRIPSREQFRKLVCALGQLAFTLVREIRKRVGDRKYRCKFAKGQIVMEPQGNIDLAIFKFVLIRDAGIILYLIVGIFDNFISLHFSSITKTIVNSCDPLIYPQNFFYLQKNLKKFRFKIQVYR